VLPINRRGLTLAVDAGGAWVVGEEESTARPVGDVLMGMLPVLERPWEQVASTPLPPGVPAPPWEEVLRLALTWPSVSGYWHSHALRWCEEGFPVAGLLDELGRLKDARGLPQSVRHRAERLWKDGWCSRHGWSYHHWW
jgi:hypothetical protein